ncbi:LuxR C-terminal-related transcriptional regulator [Streptomyces sp. NBC_01794]|uniref:helix-turn-helix transcriptional regulator n=1 Tax=Streptomyces sp. NBC_01794 TaxID=2975942 RepID=UPI003872B3F3
MNLTVRRWPLVGRERELRSFASVWAEPRYSAFVICGSAGVGKTRLAEECLEGIAREGTRVGRATASRAASVVPLGAIAHLLPSGVDLSDPVQGFAAVTRKLSGPDQGQSVVLVDDMHLLDETSAVLLRQLMDARVVRIITTIRTGEVVGNAVDALVRGGNAFCVELQEFNRDEVEQVLEAVLGSRVGRRTLNTLFTASGGNALFLRELVHGAVALGTLDSRGEIWELTGGRLPSTWQLAELVKQRLATAAPQGRPVLELLALCGTVPLADAEAAATTQVVADLEDTGLIRTLSEGRRATVALAHPLYGEVLRDALPTVRGRILLKAQAERTENWGARRRDDALHIANWRLSTTGTADPALLLQGAVLARYSCDYQQAVTLLRALPHHTARSLLLLGASLFENGEPEDADEVLLQAEGLALTDKERLQAVFIRSMNLSWNCGDAADALMLNDAARTQLTGPGEQRMLRVNEGCLRLMMGEPARGLTLLDDLDEDPLQAPNLGIWLMASLLRPPVLAAVGQSRKAVDQARRAYNLRCRLNDPAPLVLFSNVAYLISLVSALNHDGDIAEARELSQRAWDELSSSRDRPLPWILLPYQQAATELLAGHIGDARRWYAESAAQCRAFQNHQMMRRVLSGLAATAALQGHVKVAEDMRREALSYPESFPPDREEYLGQAWLLAAHGRLDQARQVLADGARSAREDGWASIEAQLLTDIARLGGAAEVVHRLAELAEHGEGTLPPVRARLAAALADDKPDELLAVADELQNLGMDLLAAEAAVTASAALSRAGDDRRAAAAAGLAATCASRCQGARTPLLRAAAPTAVPLTEREREVALLAADGLASKDIAAALHLSTRTVNNHLQHVYTKLGISSRQQLLGHFHSTR